MAAGNVPRFMRDNADHFARGLSLHEHADIDEHAAAVGHKGVEALVVDQDDLRLGMRDAGDLEDRLGVVAQQGFCFCVADQRQLATLCLRRGNCKRQGEGERTGQGNGFADQSKAGFPVQQLGSRHKTRHGRSSPIRHFILAFYRRARWGEGMESGGPGQERSDYKPVTIAI